MVISKDTPGKIKFVAMVPCHNNMNKQERKKEIHVLGFSRFMATAAPVTAGQVFLDTAASVTDRGACTRVQQEEQVDGFRWT